jgi:hypothetical protein
VRRGGFWAKHMGLKSDAIGNILGGHIENLGNNLEKWYGIKFGKPIFFHLFKKPLSIEWSSPSSQQQITSMCLFMSM